MALVKDPVARAQAAKTKVQAARLHLELESELGLNEKLPDGWEAQAERAIEILESQASEQDWGDLRDPDATTGYTRSRGGQRIPHPFTPRLSHGARKGLDDGDGEPSHDGTPPRRGDPPATRRAKRAHSARRRILSAPSMPGLGGSRQLASTALWGGLGLVLLYLLVTDAENPGRGWPSAVQTAVGSITTAIMAIVRPVDPLRPRGATPARSASAAPVHVPSSPTAGPTPLPGSPLRVAHPSTRHLVHPVSRM
jgi:hypothetical protein